MTRSERGVGDVGRPGSTCSYTGVGAEGGPLTVARLQAGGRLLKVLGHAEMASQAKDLPAAWWRPAWEDADIVVFGIGHHFRNVDGSFQSYEQMVSDSLASFAAHSKPHAQLILRSSNVGHPRCAEANAPLSSRHAAWAELGGWGWRPPAQGFTPAYFGAPREGTMDKYDWRAPPLYERKWLKRARQSPDRRSGEGGR